LQLIAVYVENKRKGIPTPRAYPIEYIDEATLINLEKDLKDEMISKEDGKKCKKNANKKMKKSSKICHDGDIVVVDKGDGHCVQEIENTQIVLYKSHNAELEFVEEGIKNENEGKQDGDVTVMVDNVADCVDEIQNSQIVLYKSPNVDLEAVKEGNEDDNSENITSDFWRKDTEISVDQNDEWAEFFPSKNHQEIGFRPLRTPTSGNHLYVLMPTQYGSSQHCSDQV